MPKKNYSYRNCKQCLKEFKPTNGCQKYCKEHRGDWTNKEYCKFRRYGITKEEFHYLLKIQNNCCAICKSSDPKKSSWSIDHDHRTGEVRGLLCHFCNTMLGFAKDNSIILRSAIDYLENK